MVQIFLLRREKLIEVGGSGEEGRTLEGGGDGDEGRLGGVWGV